MSPSYGSRFDKRVEVCHSLLRALMQCVPLRNEVFTQYANPPIYSVGKSKVNKDKFGSYFVIFYE